MGRWKQKETARDRPRRRQAHPQQAPSDSLPSCQVPPSKLWTLPDRVSSWKASTHSPLWGTLPTQTDKCSCELQPKFTLKPKSQTISRDEQQWPFHSLSYVVLPEVQIAFPYNCITSRNSKYRPACLTVPWRGFLRTLSLYFLGYLS